jgi:hypothetical protein
VEELSNREGAIIAWEHGLTVTEHARTKAVR